MPRISFSLGVAPENASRFTSEIESSILEHAANKHVRAIGSCGLDENRDGTQLDVFKRHIALAHETALPLIIEARGAYDEALDVLLTEGVPEHGILLRGFDGTEAQLARWLERAPYVSFDVRAANDPVTFSSLARMVPETRIVVESGAPASSADALTGYPARPDQVVFAADALISICPAPQLAENVKAFLAL